MKDVRKVWNQEEFYFRFIMCLTCSSRHSTRHLSRFIMLVRILLNTLSWTVAQQSVILCLR
jgi:hypothetical protein